MESATGKTLVLLFNTAAPVARAAQLHAEDCSMVRSANGKRVKLIKGSDVDDDVADLEERGFPVKQCKCCNGGVS